MPDNQNPLNIDIPVKLSGLKIAFSVAALPFEGDRPTAAYDAKWGQFLITPAMFTGPVYQGV